MAQIDAWLKRKFQESGLSYLDDIWEMYSFVPNPDLRNLLAAFHTNLNKWFATMNGRINQRPDDDGNMVYDGGYFKAQDSRDYLSLLEELDAIKSRVNSTEYAFQLKNVVYDSVIRQTRRFISNSNGSEIPKGFAPIPIEELTPIFVMSTGISIKADTEEKYVNLKTIGEGSYAKVFSYIDPIYQIPIVLKRAKANLDLKELERFKLEFETLKSLKSPYIVEVFAYNENRNEYTMEYLDENIYTFISRDNTKLSLSKRKSIITQICKGLSYIHKRNLFHRDLSLTNIFVRHYEDVDVVKIGDFGLVKTPESTLTSEQTELKGSLNDPDLINVGFAKYEMCHETYALTRVCYFILTGRTNIDKQKNGRVKDFWTKGTSPDRTSRFTSAWEVCDFVQTINEDDL